MIDYSPMWEYMSSHNISQYYLIKNGIDTKTLYNHHFTTLQVNSLPPNQPL